MGFQIFTMIVFVLIFALMGFDCYIDEKEAAKTRASLDLCSQLITELYTSVHTVMDTTSRNHDLICEDLENKSDTITDIIKRMEAAEEGIRKAEQEASNAQHNAIEISKYYLNYREPLEDTEKLELWM